MRPLYEKCLDTLKSWFNYPQEKLYCQVATSEYNIPHIRTMELYHLTETGGLVFLTATSSRKWKHLKTCSNISVCAIHARKGQIIAQGHALLKTRDDDASLCQYYWETFLNPYWKNFYWSLSNDGIECVKGIPLSFGVIIVNPTFLERLTIDDADYLKSVRQQFYFQDNSWRVKTVGTM